jgi:hypothetical protein
MNEQAIIKKVFTRLRQLVVVDDPLYDRYELKYQAQTLQSKAFYIFAYFLPGIIALLLINVKPVHEFLSNLFGFEGYNFQYYTFVIFTLGWHLAFPILMLRHNEKLKWKEVWEFLSLNRFSFKEIFIVAPIAFAMSVIFSLPYMMSLYEPFQNWINSVPELQIPAHSIFASYEAFYGAPALLMGLMLIGNFVGEEVYFRGYLMKKTAFLGKYNWLANSFLFCTYHLWQVPQTYPLIVPFLFFGLVMLFRKNLYTLIVFHLLFNLAGVQIYNVLLGLGTH